MRARCEPRLVQQSKVHTSHIWGDRRDLNPRHPRPQRGALPTELRPPLRDYLRFSEENLGLLRRDCHGGLVYPEALEKCKSGRDTERLAASSQGNSPALARVLLRFPVLLLRLGQDRRRIPLRGSTAVRESTHRYPPTRDDRSEERRVGRACGDRWDEGV